MKNVHYIISLFIVINYNNSQLSNTTRLLLVFHFDIEEICQYQFFNQIFFTVPDPPVVVDRRPNPVYVWPGRQNRNLTCCAEADPTPSMRWTHNNAAVINNETFFIHSTEGCSVLEASKRA